MKVLMSILSLSFFLSNSIYYSQSILINDLNWSTKNLNVSKFNNGDAIFQAKSEQEWIEACKKKIPAFIVIVNKMGETEKLYNYYVLADNRGVLPKNTRYPSGSEFLSLSSYLKNNPKSTKDLNFILSEAIYTESCGDLSKQSLNDFWYLDLVNFPIADALEMDMGASMAISVCGDESVFPLCQDGSFSGFMSSGGFGGLGSGKLIRFIYINSK